MLCKCLVLTKRIPFGVSIDSGNKHDLLLLPNVINNCVINCNTKKYSKHNKYKQYLLADSGYDSKKKHNFLINRGYKSVIIQNKRNIKKLKRI